MCQILSVLLCLLLQPCMASEFSIEDLEDLVGFLGASIREKASQPKFKEGHDESVKEAGDVYLIADSSLEQTESEDGDNGSQCMEQSSNMHPDKRLSDVGSTAGHSRSE